MNCHIRCQWLKAYSLDSSDSKPRLTVPPKKQRPTEKTHETCDTTIFFSREKKNIDIYIRRSIPHHHFWGIYVSFSGVATPGWCNFLNLQPWGPGTFGLCRGTGEAKIERIQGRAGNEEPKACGENKVENLGENHQRSKKNWENKKSNNNTSKKNWVETSWLGGLLPVDFWWVGFFVSNSITLCFGVYFL